LAAAEITALLSSLGELVSFVAAIPAPAPPTASAAAAPATTLRLCGHFMGAPLDIDEAQETTRG
jgi:hypothetical protein